MVRHVVLEVLKPEGRHLRKNLPFVGNWRGKYNVEGGESVRSDNQEVVAEIINISNLAPRMQFHAGQVCLLNGHSFSSTLRKRFWKYRALPS